MRYVLATEEEILSESFGDKDLKKRKSKDFGIKTINFEL
jgi:hypothetical protein